MTGYLANVSGPMPLVLDLRIAHERWGSSSDPSINGHLHAITSTSGRLHSEFVRLLFLQPHRATNRFFEDSGVHLTQHHHVQFHYRSEELSSQFKSKIGNILAKAAALRIF